MMVNGIVYGNREVSPKMQEVKFNYQNITAVVGKTEVKIVNKNLFVNTDTFECRVTVARDGHIIRRATLETCVEPLGEGTYALPVPQETLAGEYAVTVSFHLKEDKLWAERGHEVAFGQYVYQIEKAEKACCKGVKVIRSTHNIGVQGEHFEVMFSVLSGGLVSYKFGGKEMLKSIPKPNFWRAPVDNDCGNQMPARYAQWKIASMYASDKALDDEPFKMNMLKAQEGEHSATVSFTYHLCTVPASKCQVSTIIMIR